MGFSWNKLSEFALYCYVLCLLCGGYLENVLSYLSANFQTNFNALGNIEGRGTTRLNIVSWVTTILFQNA